MFSKNFKKGKYYIGDPCYAVKEQKDWSKLLDDTDYFEAENQFYKGYPILGGGTAYGDGIYKDNEGRKYSVDAGLIGIMPIEAIDKECENIERLGNIIDFDNNFITEIKDGIFKFGDIVIDTIGEYEEE
ncbi:hypothetical protein RSJ2_3982 (plasmid) [Clostridium botulinum]|uniref:hypothetical protein n=1 Tax=Clostridium botulinum TaxID=1491 RepID=UPI000466D5EB|nr:hypothetical protein [Clostridium botulinum]APR02385.1 hypothetical protein RSJ2_3982 [Clostridium botulinum]QDY27079.1 hypothetical protein CGQ40_20455 [Clostridium botulinum]